MGFRLTPRLMTLYDIELYKFKFSENFAGFRRFRTDQQLNKRRQTSIVSDNVVSTSNWSNVWHAFASRGFVSNSWAFLLYLLDTNRFDPEKRGMGLQKATDMFCTIH